MGSNTLVFVLNDRLDEIKRNAQKFADDIYTWAGGARERKDTVGQTTVMPTAHADIPRLYATRYNSIVDLSPYSEETMTWITNDPHMRAFIKELVGVAASNVAGLKKAIKAAEEHEKKNAETLANFDGA